MISASKVYFLWGEKTVPSSTLYIVTSAFLYYGVHKDNISFVFYIKALISYNTLAN